MYFLAMLVLFFKDSIITNTHISLSLFPEAVSKLYNFEQTAIVLFLNPGLVLSLSKIERCCHQKEGYSL